MAAPSRRKVANSSYNSSSSFHSQQQSAMSPSLSIIPQKAPNPWNDDNSFAQQSRNALMTAEQMNITTWQDESANIKTLADLPSFKQIALQKEISQKRDVIWKLKQEISSYSQQKESVDMLCLQLIKKRINMVKAMCADIETTLRNKERLITKLQTPFVGDFIKVDAEYHKYVHEVLADLVPSMNNIGPYLDNLSWLGFADLSSTITEPLGTEIQSLIASLHTSYQMLHRMKTGMEEMKQKISNSEG